MSQNENRGRKHLSRKVLWLAMALLAASLVLVSCGSSDSEEEDAEEEETTEAEETEAAEEAEEAEEEEEEDEYLVFSFGTDANSTTFLEFIQ